MIRTIGSARINIKTHLPLRYVPSVCGLILFSIYLPWVKTHGYKIFHPLCGLHKGLPNVIELFFCLSRNNTDLQYSNISSNYHGIRIHFGN